MQVRNQRLYAMFIKSKRRESDVASLSWAFGIAAFVEEKVRSGGNKVDAIKAALERPKPAAGITPLMEKLAVSFLVKTWEHGITFGVIYDQTRCADHDQNQHHELRENAVG